MLNIGPTCSWTQFGYLVYWDTLFVAIFAATEHTESWRPVNSGSARWQRLTMLDPVPRSNEPETVPRYPRDAVDVNAVVSYNLRAAREQNGWTQEQFADRLAAVTGGRPNQAGVSALERVWERGKRREFDPQELVDFALVPNVPVLWFFLPSPGDRREIKNTGRQLFALIDLLVGRAEHLPRIEERQYSRRNWVVVNEHLPRIEERQRQLGLRENTAEEEISRILTGHPDVMTPQVIRERREWILTEILHEMTTELDQPAERWGSFFDRVRQVTLRGVIASLTDDAQFLDHLPDLPEDRNGIGGRLSAQTVRNVHITIRGALSDTERKGTVVLNVADLADAPTTSRSSRTMSVWISDELRSSLDAISDYYLYPLYLLAAATGMRRAETAGLL